MNLRKSLLLLERYANCDDCGSGLIGEGEGTVDIGDTTFTRTCKCGWKVKTGVDGYPWIEVGDTVEVVGADSMPASFLGWSGTVTKDVGGKVMVLFIPREGSVGSLSHTGLRSDLRKVEGSR